jgi:hypothetical protein
MVYKRKFRVMMALFILAAMLIFPVHLFAQEATETVEHETGFYYTVQKGDTLWDLSSQFSDNPWLWPNLWSENSQISNPHWIYPGERIRLLQVKGVDTFITKNIEENQSKEPEPKEETLYYYYSPINRIGFIKKQAITPLGTIFKVEDDKDLVSVGDIIYIRPNVDYSFKTGTKYTVYRTLKPIVDENTKNLVGIQHYITGVAVITKKEPDFVVARVVKSYRSIALNDLLMPYKKRSPRIALTQSKNGLNGKIIVAEEHDKNIGDHTVAFINKGDQDGVKIGQSYSIYYQEKGELNKKSKREILLTPNILGSLLVLHTEPTTSTVLITQSDRSIDPGAKIFSPIK